MNHRYGRAAILGIALASLLHEANKPRPLADLPNSEGFKFTGHKLDGTKVQCVVRKVKAHDGKLDGFVYETYRAFTLDGVPIFQQLRAWSPEEF